MIEDCSFVGCSDGMGLYIDDAALAMCPLASVASDYYV